MSRMEIKFDLDNAAFLDEYQEPSPSAKSTELDRIFQRIGDAVWEGNTEGRIRDSNGNTVGRWEITS